MAQSVAQRQLLGRDVERASIDALLAQAREGRSASLLLRGEAGIGKTSLLRYAVERAADMTVVCAHGIGSESEIPFSGLLEALRPLLDRLDEIPAPQAAALRSALALGPAIASDRFAISAATLSLLATAASERPLLVGVDDLQWLDTASAESLLFAARRLEAEPVALLFTLRDGGSTTLETSGMPQLILVGLDRSTSLALLESRVAVPVAEAVADRLFSETRGNPLALLEIVQLLSSDQIGGHEPLQEPLPAGASIERLYARRIAELPDDARTALLVAAAADSGELETICAALRELGTGPEELEVAEGAGLVEITDLRLQFCHPLARSSVYHGASAASRRSVHRALASALAAKDDERRAWHLAVASLEPNEEVAAALERAGAGARDRSGYAAAAAALERAARLTPDSRVRAARLYAAAEACQLANHCDRAVGLLEEASPAADDPLLAADIRHLRARIDTWRGPALEAHRLLLDGAEELEQAAPEKATAMLTDAVLPAITAGRLDLAVVAGRRALALAQRIGGVTELLAALQLGKALIVFGEAQEGYPLIMRCRELLERPDALEHSDTLAQCVPALLSVEEYALADRLLATVIARARATNALGELPYDLGALAELETRVGRWTSAYANAFESIHLAREARQQGQLSYNLARLARLEAAQGREEACRAHVTEALELAESLRFGSTFPFAHSALGLLELGLGRFEQAVAHLEETRRWSEETRIREPGRLEWAPDLVESYLRSQRREDAERALRDLQLQAEQSVRPWTLAVLHRCRGLLFRDARVEDEFRMALGWHEQSATPFERARTELCYGERLRRQGRRVEARAQLRAAHEAFVRLGAVPWAERARTELAATGEKLRPGRDGESSELTSQELQVALIVAGGATNKEAGAALFLTPKTIEFHLAKIYRKLGVRSRTELAHRLGQEWSGAPRELRPQRIWSATTVS